MLEASLTVQPREHTGKGYARKLRQAGKVPGIYYSHGQKAIPLEIDEKELTRIVSSDVSLINLNLGKRKPDKCVIREIQFDPVRGNPIHIDLMGIKMTEKTTFEIPIRLIGTPIGVKASGGVLHQDLREIEVECLPMHLPEHIDVDVSHLDIGEAVHVGDLSFENLTFLMVPERPIATVRPPTVTPEVVTEEIVKEPELVGKEKKEKEEPSETP